MHRSLVNVTYEIVCVRVRLHALHKQRLCTHTLRCIVCFEFCELLRVAKKITMVYVHLHLHGCFAGIWCVLSQSEQPFTIVSTIPNGLQVSKKTSYSPQLISRSFSTLGRSTHETPPALTPVRRNTRASASAIGKTRPYLTSHFLHAQISIVC